MDSISASVLETAGCVSDRNSAVRQVAKLIQRHQHLQMAQFQVAAQHTVNQRHRSPPFWFTKYITVLQ